MDFRMKQILSAITVILFSSMVLAQPAVDGFMKGKSNLDMALGGTYESFGQYFWKQNDLTPVGRTSIAASVFGAYGITSWLDAQVNIPYIYTVTDFANWQDVAGYVKISPFNKYFSSGNNLRIIVAGGLSAPMSDYQTEGLNAIGQQATALDGRAVIQYQMTNGFFVMVQGGYISRSDSTPSASVAALKFGWAKEKHYIDVWYDQQIADGGNDYFQVKTGIDPDISFRTLGVSYGKVGVTYYRPFKSGNSGISFGTFFVLWGRNIGQASALSVSYVKRFSFSSK
jgi:hypothetical protein